MKRISECGLAYMMQMSCSDREAPSGSIHRTWLDLGPLYPNYTAQHADIDADLLELPAGTSRETAAGHPADRRPHPP